MVMYMAQRFACSKVILHVENMYLDVYNPALLSFCPDVPKGTCLYKPATYMLEGLLRYKKSIDDLAPPLSFIDTYVYPS